MADAESTSGDGLEPAAHPLSPTAGAPGEPAPVVVDSPVGIRDVSLSVLATVAVILLLQYASTVFIPVVLAILISHALSPPVTSLAKHGIPPAVGAGVVLLLLLTALGLGVYSLRAQAAQIVEQVPAAAQRIRERLKENRQQPGGVVESVQRAATEVEKTANEATPATAAATSPKGRVTQVEVVQPTVDLWSYIWSGGMTILSLLGQFTLVVFLVYFFLVTGDLYKRKLVKIAGPTFSEKKLTVQILDEINRQIVISSDRPPKEIPTLEDRLRSRFEQGLLADIQPPDFETRLAILKSKLGLSGGLISEPVLTFIAHKVQKNIRELEGALTRVLAFAAIHQRQIDEDEAASLLSDIIPAGTRRPLTIQRIQQTVADYYNLSTEDMKSKRRDKHIVFPRQVAMFLVREETPSSLPVIGQAFAGRDHTTALHSIDKIANELKEDERLRNDLQVLRERIYAE